MQNIHDDIIQKDLRIYLAKSQNVQKVGNNLGGIVAICFIVAQKGKRV